MNRQNIARFLIIASNVVSTPFNFLAHLVNPCPIPEIDLVDANYDKEKGEMKVSIRSDGIRILADAMAETFFDIGGDNYAVMTMFSPTLGLFEVIIQRKFMDTKTPSEMVTILRNALNDIDSKCTCGVTAVYSDLMKVAPFDGFDPPIWSK